ncbi:hypothetical protein C8R46DRAFT_1345295 [Mycena filopes]|nr:hypothetical protein C8R46DRAFT_1345295 [Mycena filopes]
MARIAFTLVAVLCAFQSLAAPLQPRASAAISCSSAVGDAVIGIQRARTALGPINTNNDIGNAQNLLLAQLSLLEANNGTTNILLANLRDPNGIPALADQQRIANGLLAAQGNLNKTALLDNTTLAAVTSAKAAVTEALVTAQQVLQTPCTV